MPPWCSVVFHEQVDEPIVVVVTPRAVVGIPAVVDNSSGCDLGERRVNVQPGDLAGDRSGYVRNDSGVVTRVGELQIGQDQRGIGSGGKIRPVPTPLVIERCGAGRDDAVGNTGSEAEHRKIRRLTRLCDRRRHEHPHIGDHAGH